MRVVIWSLTFPPALGGLERFSEELATWLAQRGHDVDVLTRTPGGSADDRLPYRVRRGFSRTQAMQLMRKADAIQVSGLSVEAVALAAGSGRRPVVTHTAYQAICPNGLAWSGKGPCDAEGWGRPCRSCEEGGVRGTIDLVAHRSAAAAVARNVFVSRAQQRRVALAGEVIYNPVPASMFRPPSTGGEAGLIVAAGRYVREKGFDLLIRAMAEVDARLILAGDGPLRPALEALAAEVGAVQRVDFVGRLEPEALIDLFTRAAVVCVPSLWDEPFGYAVAEAMAAGAPVVGTPTGAIVELLADGRGYVASAVTSPALAASLRGALQDADHRASTAARSSAFARAELHVDAVGPRYERRYTR